MHNIVDCKYSTRDISNALNRIKRLFSKKKVSKHESHSKYSGNCLLATRRSKSRQSNSNLDFKIDAENDSKKLSKESPSFETALEDKDHSRVEITSLVDQADLAVNRPPEDCRLVKTKCLCCVFFHFESQQIDVEIDNTGIMELFSNFGNVSNVCISKTTRHEITNLQNGYGFIFYEKSMDGIKAVKEAVRHMACAVINQVCYNCHPLLSNFSLVHLFDGTLYELKTNSTEPRELTKSEQQEEYAVRDEPYPLTLQF